MFGGAGHRNAIAALFSATVHTALLLICAATSVRIAADADRLLIPLVICEPVPPPQAGSAAAPSEVLIAPPAPPALRPQPARPTVAAKPKPRVAASRPPTPRLADPVPAPAVAAPLLAPATGAVDGVAAGRADGLLSGRRDGVGQEVFRADQVALPPTVLEAVRPRYPTVARQRGQEGVVVVQAIIDPAGDIEDDSLRVVESRPPFDDAALAAFRRWRFRPGRDQQGNAVRVIVEQPIRFQLR